MAIEGNKNCTNQKGRTESVPICRWYDCLWRKSQGIYPWKCWIKQGHKKIYTQKSVVFLSSMSQHMGAAEI